MQYEQVTRRDWERTALYLAGGMLFIMTAAIFLFAINRVIGAIIWFALIGVVLAILVSWHTKTYAYKCKRCGEEFEISPLTNFVSPQGFGKNGARKYLKCPRCDKHESAEVLKKSTDDFSGPVCCSSCITHSFLSHPSRPARLN